MTDRGEPMRRPLRAPMPRRTRRRWAVAAAVAACWAVALALTGSLIAGTVLLLLAAAFGTACLLALRAMGVSAAHPAVPEQPDELVTAQVPRVARGQRQYHGLGHAPSGFPPPGQVR